MDQFDVKRKSINAFSTASLVCGIMSLVLFWTGFMPLLAGSMGIIFAVLSRREDTPFPSSSWWGMVMSGIAIFMGITIILYAIKTMIIPMMTDPAYYQEMKVYYQNYYGINLDELFLFQ